ncbi:MAG: hypothetical protein U0936_01825 [Planctomycetaceae bacterium]
MCHITVIEEVCPFIPEPVWSRCSHCWPLHNAVFVTWLGYPRRIKHLTTGWQRILIGLRLAIVFVISLLLLRPIAVFERDDKSEAILYVMTDASSSMQTEDAAGGETRRQALLKTLKAIQPSLDEIGKKAEIVYRDYAADVAGEQARPPPNNSMEENLR